MKSNLSVYKGPPEGQLLQDFNSVVTRVYPADSLRMKQAEKFNHSYLGVAVIVYRDSIPVARCVLYDDPQLLHEGEAVLQIGHYESLHDQEACAMLVQAAADEGMQSGKAWLIGPMDGSTWDSYRFALGTQEDPFLTEPVQQPYYPML